MAKSDIAVVSPEKIYITMKIVVLSYFTRYGFHREVWFSLQLTPNEWIRFHVLHLWFPNQSVQDADTWTLPQRLQLKRDCDVLVDQYSCVVEEDRGAPILRAKRRWYA